MLIVVSTRHDPEARSLVARWALHDAALLTCEDLSVEGWRHYLKPEAASVAMIGGRSVAVEEIHGVLTRWPNIFPQELAHIVADDRTYVASEMTAFLRSWLYQLQCPVLNRPTSTSLAGPGWRPEQWVYVAAQIGINVRPVRRHARRLRDAPADTRNLQHSTVTVVGKHCFGEVAPELAKEARRLADAAEVDLLAVHFTGPEKGAALLSADPLPDLSDDHVADAVLDYLLREA